MTDTAIQFGTDEYDQLIDDMESFAAGTFTTSSTYSAFLYSSFSLIKGVRLD